MDTVDEGLGILVGLAVHVSGCGDEFGDGPVGQKHEFLDQPVGLPADFLVDPDRSSGSVHLYLHFRALETDGSRSETALPQDRGEAVEFQNGFLGLSRNQAALEDSLTHHRLLLFFR